MRERHAPSVTDTKLLLQTIRNEGGYPTNLIARMLYGCGLRVTEPLNLRIKDINLEGCSTSRNYLVNFTILHRFCLLFASLVQRFWIVVTMDLSNLLPFTSLRLC